MAFTINALQTSAWIEIENDIITYSRQSNLEFEAKCKHNDYVADRLIRHRLFNMRVFDCLTNSFNKI